MVDDLPHSTWSVTDTRNTRIYLRTTAPGQRRRSVALQALGHLVLTHTSPTQVDEDSNGSFAVSVGVPFVHVKWFRGRETTARAVSRCPDPTCCREAPSQLAARWGEFARPSARAHSHLLAALPPGTYPGVDDTEVFRFLEAQAQAQRLP